MPGAMLSCTVWGHQVDSHRFRRETGRVTGTTNTSAATADIRPASRHPRWREARPYVAKLRATCGE